jgi:hypothetical protein
VLLLVFFIKIFFSRPDIPMSANYLFKGIKNNTIPMIVKSGHVGTAIPGEWIIYPGRATAGWAEHAKPSLLDRHPVGAESSLLDRRPAAIKQRISNIEVEYRMSK